MESNTELMRRLFASAIMFIVFSLFHFEILEAQAIEKLPQFEIGGSQVIKMNSTITGQEYVLHINLPQRYGDTNRTFPVIYLLDSQWDFPLITSIYGTQYYDGFMPNVIIVGITWGGENPKYDTRRAFDLTPTDNGKPAQYGNAEKFLLFIKKEVIPFIDSKFRTDKNNRSLAGHSFGGLFTLFALLTEPDLFNQYIPGSPAWAWDRASLYKYLEKFSEAKLTQPVKVYAYMGEYEDVGGFERLIEAIRNCKVKNLELEAQIIKGAGHAGTKPEGYNRGLQYVFKRPCVSIEQKILERYAGEYEIDSNTKIKIVAEDGWLIVFPQENFSVKLCATSENEFYLLGSFLNASFAIDNKGKVTGAKIQQYSNELFAKKIN